MIRIRCSSGPDVTVGQKFGLFIRYEFSTDHCDQVSSTLALCTGDPGFKSWPGKLLLIKFVVFQSSFSHILDSTSDWDSFHCFLNLLLANHPAT
jgi:hypothetical protein